MPNAIETAASVAAPIACWFCSFQHPGIELFCPQCGKIQPPPAGDAGSHSRADYFQVFTLDRRFQIDLPALEQQFHTLSRKVHPDRFARASENERQWSLVDTALLNDAYRTLKDPLTRTEYLLKLSGAEIGEEHAGKDRSNLKDPSRVPADLLEEVFELNMQLEEMRMARKMGETEPQLQADLQQAMAKFETLLAAVDSDLHAQWQIWDTGDATARESAQKTMVAQLDRRRYLRNLVRDVTETLGA